MSRSLFLPALVFGSAAVAIAMSARDASAQTAAIPGWRLVWRDEFNGFQLNANNWNTENVAWPDNNELEYYLPQQAYTQNGSLVIASEAHPYGGRPYISARLNTQNHFAQQYGHFEARMQLPAGKGLWPAFWLLPPAVWPPEIDIMEAVGNPANLIYMTQHWGTASNPAAYGGTYSGPDYTAGFHVFACEWSPTQINWFIDGVQRFTTSSNIPQMPMNIIVNTAVGGDLPGNPDGTTVFPQYTYVDYVRAYLRDLPLLNPGFETPGTGVPFASWQTFGNAIASTANPHGGSQALQVFGIAGSGPYYSGAFQDLPASPGEVWNATAFAMHTSANPLTGSDFAVLKIEWNDSTGANISFVQQTAVSPTTPTDVYAQTTVSATAPAGTATARVSIVFVQATTGSGAAYFDDVTFGYSQPVRLCSGDFNQDGTVSVQDIFDFLTAWFAASPSADFNQSGAITVQDIFDFLAAWFSPC